MKKRKVTAFILSTYMLLSCILQPVYAKDRAASVTDVTECKAWDALRTRYITYTINGIKYDSREMGQETNTAAFDAMSDADFQRVLKAI